MALIAKTLAGMIILVGIAVLGYRAYYQNVHSAPGDSEQVPVLVSGIDEPPEMRVPPMPVFMPTPPEQMLADAMKASGTAGINGMGPALERIIAKYPDYPDAYVFRLEALCKGSDRAAIVSTVNHALKYIANSHFSSDSASSLYSMRAKAEHDGGYDKDALDDLDKVLHSNAEKALDFANSGATAPEKSASSCTWTETDMDQLVRKFPNDYRAHMFQGLYYSFFEMFKPETVNTAIKAFGRAADLNNKSALPMFFMTQALKKAYTFKRLGMAETEKDGLNRMIVQGMTKALAIDPNLLPALSDRAEAYFELKRYREAVADYDKTLSLNPTDETAYNDRALAKIETGNFYGAIDDFGKSITNKKRELQHSSSYEGRSTAYVKTQQWDHAIADLDAAISLQIGGLTLLSNIEQFRAIYPEYKAASNDAVAHKLRDTFYPNMQYPDFAKAFLRDNVPKFFSSTTTPDLYLKRSDVKLKAGKWHGASVDFQRASNGFPQYASAIERWREIGSRDNEHTFIDMKTFDDSHRESSHLWIKQSQGALDVTAPYSVHQYELNCTTRQIRSISSASYDGGGNVIGASEGGKWESIVPDSLAENLFDGSCQTLGRGDH